MVYHLCNKSIAGFVIFNNDVEYGRMIDGIKYYQIGRPMVCLSQFTESNKEDLQGSIKRYVDVNESKRIARLIAYCLMPTHLHLLVEEISENSAYLYAKNILNSYTRYFNIKHKRKGPLWEGRSKRIEVKTDEQLIHLTRYIHLNPVTANIVKKPEDWPYSSYREYLRKVNNDDAICNYKDLLEIDPASYKAFVESNIEYQKELARLKAIF
jgi:putative transposase